MSGGYVWALPPPPPSLQTWRRPVRSLNRQVPDVPAIWPNAFFNALFRDCQAASPFSREGAPFPYALGSRPLKLPCHPSLPFVTSILILDGCLRPISSPLDRVCSPTLPVIHDLSLAPLFTMGFCQCAVTSGPALFKISPADGFPTRAGPLRQLRGVVSVIQNLSRCLFFRGSHAAWSCGSDRLRLPGRGAFIAKLPLCG